MLRTEDCPHADAYLPRLRELLAGAGIDVPVRVRVVLNADQAQQERFLGSPTIRVGGRDVEPGSAQRQDYGLACRLYAHPDGRRGNPPDEWVLSALRQRPEAEHDR
jgi:hypothetical protein